MAKRIDDNRGESTCWSLIQNAAEGEQNARETFARLYQSVVLGFLKSRWAGTRDAFDLDDAIQDVFIDCFKPNGALQRWQSGRDGGFRGYLYGVVRNVALRHEEKRRKMLPLDFDFEADQTSAESAFDRAWARSLMKEASRDMAESAKIADGNATDQIPSDQTPHGDMTEMGRAMRRVQLLKERFNKNRPIREIASEWQVDPAWLHHEYATARQEFRAALLRVIAFHDPHSTRDEQERTLKNLLESLS